MVVNKCARSIDRITCKAECLRRLLCRNGQSSFFGDDAESGEAFEQETFHRSEEHTSEFQSQLPLFFLYFFFFKDGAPTEISPLSPHDALPISLPEWTILLLRR